MSDQSRRHDAYFSATIDAVRGALSEAVRDAVDEAATSLRKARAFCDQLDESARQCSHREGGMCPLCAGQQEVAAQFRALLPPVPPVSEGDVCPTGTFDKPTT